MNTKVATTVLITMSVAFAGASLITNGDFESGTSAEFAANLGVNTGFTSDYTYVGTPGPTALNPEGTYTVTSGAPNAWHSSFWTGTDLSLGGNNRYMLVNGGIEGRNLWISKPKIDLQANTTYVFSVDITTVVGETSGTAAKLKLIFGNQILPGQIVSDLGVGWKRKSITFTTTSSVDGGTLFDLQTAAGSNDFALDNLSLEAVPEPFTMALGAAALGLAIARRRRTR